MESVQASWPEADAELLRWLEDHTASSVEAYRVKPLLLAEHANQEESFRTGGYSGRLVLELLQNAADALHRGQRRGRVEVRLDEEALYCANEGVPLDRRGLEAISHAFLSDKRGDEIGRFGLGFKSVLTATDTPMVLSRSVSVGFDAERARTALGDLASPTTSFPILRLPGPVDAAAELRADPILAQLAAWADTVVKLPLRVDAERIERELREVPLEFLLFAPAVDELHLKVERAGGSPLARVYRCQAVDGGRHRLLSHDGQSSDWILRQREHRPSAEAQEEVGQAVRRERVTVSYAAPVDDAVSTGRFWAYFPLSESTSARGILNAPWRINDDRTSMLTGTFNRELLAVAAALIAEVLPELCTVEDPARHFDYMPARGREATNEADRYLTIHVPRLLARSACVPDADGTLRAPAELRILDPDQTVGPALHERWHAAPSRPRDTAHPFCYRSPVRRARLRTLLRGDSDRPSALEITPSVWVELLAPDLSDDQCRTALSLVATVEDQRLKTQMRQARILPDGSGQVHRLDASLRVFLRGTVLSGQAGLTLVRESLLDQSGVEACLRSLGFQDVEPILELRQLLTTIRSAWGAREWRAFWDVVADCSERDVTPLLNEHVQHGGRLRLFGRDGTWHDLGTSVVAGVVQPRNPALAVDDEFHRDFAGPLTKLGVGPWPEMAEAHLQDLLVAEYQRTMREQTTGEHPRGRRTKTPSLDFREKQVVGPLYVLRRFEDTQDHDAQVSWSRALLERSAPIEWHATDPRDRNKTVTFPAPHLWAVRRFGLLTTAWGPRRAVGTLSPRLSALSPLLPVAENPDAAKLGLVDQEAGISAAVWLEFLSRRPPDGTDPWRLGALVAQAAHAVNGVLPETLPCLAARIGACAPAEKVLLAETADEVDALRNRTVPFVALAEPSDVAALEGWGCRRAEAALRVDIVAVPTGDPVVLLDRFHGLRPLAFDLLRGRELVDCLELAREIAADDGVEREPVRLIIGGDRVYRTEDVPDDELLEWLSEQLGLGLDSDVVARILDDAQQADVERIIAACRLQSDPADKLRTLLPDDVLSSKLPVGLVDGLARFGERVEDQRIARLLVELHAYDVLFELRHDLGRVLGRLLPERWSGSPPAVAFVQRLGFPRQYAGQRTRHLQPEVIVPGRSPLSELHDYQQELAAQIRELVRRPQRAIVSLPTGAGKTRVAVEALTLALVEDGLGGPLLWIAQTEELCEQAVGSWQRVWPERGAEHPLRIGRLWGSREVAEGDDELTVVVATEAKLLRCLDRDEYVWLSRPGVVIIDEAHTATSPGYTRVLTWLGISGRRTARPLLGLTATPFRGGGDDANRQLANRFDARILDVLGDDPHKKLQDKKILSKVTFRELPGKDWTLEPEEARQTERMGGMLPSAVLERLGRDEERNHRLVVDIESLPSQWRILVFTASVLSAQTLAALLTVRGIEAAAVSGSTRPEQRRRLVEGFRQGRPRVLVNCAVLTQGFDAPKVEALYIARPTFSPAAYIQMVGRGLRGERNGGSEECLVVNVADTFERFGHKLAYLEYAHLWRRQGTPTSEEGSS